MGAAHPVSSQDSARFKLGSESDLAYGLKWEAWEWLYSEARCRCIGFEVRLQGPWGAVVDVVGVGPSNVIYAVEVKASRADFARDNHTEADVMRLRHRQDALNRRIELAQTPGYRSRNGDLGRLRQESDRLRERLTTVSTKFHSHRFMGIADYHYIMAPRRVVLPEMVPPEWGLIEPGRVEIVAAPVKTIRKNTGIVSNVLRAIARANTTAMMRAHGVTYDTEGAAFPRSGNYEAGLKSPFTSTDSMAEGRLLEEEHA